MRIIIRQEFDFSPRIRRMADIMRANINNALMPGRIPMDPDKLFLCPQCRRSKMLNRFYSLAYPIEVSHCLDCRLYWFNHDDLEVLQCLIESNLDQKKSA